MSWLLSSSSASPSPNFGTPVNYGAPGTPLPLTTPSNLSSALAKLNLVQGIPKTPDQSQVGSIIPAQSSESKPTSQNIEMSPFATSFRRSKPIAKTKDQPSQFPARYMALDLMNLQCGSCQNYLFQIDIENALKTGKDMKTVLDELGYDRICCRTEISFAAPIVKLRKQLEREKEHEQDLKNLTVDQTGSVPAVVVNPQIRVLDSAPPGLKQFGGICLMPGTTDEGIQEDDDDLDFSQPGVEMDADEANFGF